MSMTHAPLEPGCLPL